MGRTTYRPGETEIGTFTSEAGWTCIVTNQRVLWLLDDTIDQMFLEEIRSVEKVEEGLFKKKYILNLWRRNDTREWTTFANAQDRDAMSNAVQRALLGR